MQIRELSQPYTLAQEPEPPYRYKVGTMDMITRDREWCELVALPGMS